MRKIFTLFLALMACVTFSLNADTRVMLKVTSTYGYLYEGGVYLHNVVTGENLLMANTWEEWFSYTFSEDVISGEYDFRPIYSGDYHNCHSHTVDIGQYSCYMIYSGAGWMYEDMQTGETITIAKPIDCPEMNTWTIRLNPQGIDWDHVYLIVKTTSGYEEAIEAHKDPVTGWYTVSYDVMDNHVLSICWSNEKQCNSQWKEISGSANVKIIVDGLLEEDDSYPTTNVTTSAPAVYTNPSNPAEKLIRDGNVYILRGDKTYTITGQYVK